MLRRLARLALTLWLIGALALAWATAQQLAATPAGGWLIERTGAGLAAAMERQMVRDATPGRLAGRLADLLEASPRDWPAIRAVEEVAAERAIPLPPDLIARRQSAWAEDSGLGATLARCGDCLLEATRCDLDILLTCRLPVDLTPLGDVAGVARAALARSLGAPVDEVDLVLSVVGLAATALVPATGGSSATVKLGAGLGKTLHHAGRLPPRLTEPLRLAARDGVDWQALPAALLRGDPGPALRPDALRPAVRLLEDTGRMARATDTRSAILLMSRADSAAELRLIANAAEALGPRALGRMEVLGKGRFLRATLRLSDSVLALALGLMAALGALAGALGAALSALLPALARRRLRRLARG